MKQAFQAVIVTIVLTGIILIANAQNVGIGTDNPAEKLEVNGAIKIGHSNNTLPGTIRWNPTKSDFEGFNGVAWVSLTGGVSQWGNQASYSTESSASNAYLYWHSNTRGTELGYALHAYGNWCIAGAYRDADINDATKWDVGSVRLFRKLGENWVRVFNVASPDRNINDYFGMSVGITATHFIAGAPYADLPGKTDAGKAFVYAYDSVGVISRDTLTASDAQADDHFGRAVAIYGDYAAAGAPSNAVGGINHMGRAYVFRRYNDQWQQMSIITPPDGAQNDAFGYTIALWQDYLAVGAPYKAANGIYNSGKVYVYRQSGAGWGLIAQLTSPDANYGEHFGFAISINNNRLAIGASDYLGNNQDGPGKVYVYQIDNNSVTYEATLMASDGQTGDKFGESVSIQDDVILAGAPFATVGAGYRQGKAYAFRKINGQWLQQAILTSSIRGINDQFGQSVALVAGYGIVGAHLADLPDAKDNGRIFFFKR